MNKILTPPLLSYWGSEVAMDSMRGQGGIQMLLTAEQEAQQIVYAARNGNFF